MFRTAELGRKVSKADFDAAAPELRTDILRLQQKLSAAKFSVIIVFAGVDGAGKGESINLLNEWMDPRYVETHAYGAPSDEERERPPMWRYWRDMPPRGKVGLFLRSWYSAPVLGHAHGRLSDAQMDEALSAIADFEKMLADDGALILKFWMHLGKDAQKKRLKKLSKDKTESWRIGERDWKNRDMYDRFITAAERVIQATSTAAAPWTIIEGSDRRYRSLRVLTTLRDAILKHMERMEARQALLAAARDKEKAAAARAARAQAASREAPLARQPSVLDSLDMTLDLGGEEYSQRLKSARARLNRLFRKAKEEGVSSVLAFEGWDAAGKGGAIRRLTSALDARDYMVIPIAAPSDEERARHCLWRFWRHLSRAGRVTIFDRSWYGRVLVERIEHFAAEEEWRRAYKEICDFERRLTDFGIVLAKYWIHITKDEQLARFEARKQSPWKSWKLTGEDWRNRGKWGDYEQAVADMIERTSTRTAPWTLVEGNSKRHARVKVIETFCDALDAALGKGAGEKAARR